MADAASATDVYQAADLRQWERRVASSLYRIDVGVGSGGGVFSGTIRARHMGGVTFALIDAQPHTGRRHVDPKRHESGSFGMSMQLSGRSTFVLNGRSEVLEPGDHSMYDTTLPYTWMSEEPTRSLIIIVPRSLLTLSERDRREGTAPVMRPRGGALGSLASNFLLGIAEHFDGIDPEAGYRVARALVELLSTHPADPAIDPGAPEAERLRRAIRDHIATNLADSELSPRTIAAHFYLSTRHLFRLFSGGDRTLAELIRDERLLLAERHLLDPSLDGATITWIAELCGYQSANYFTRVFRERNGCTPSEFRSGHLTLH